MIGLIGEYRLQFWHPRLEFFELLVLIGCAGELLADGGIFVFSEHLQKIEHTQISDLAIQASSAAGDARQAKRDAGDAKGKAQAASEIAGPAKVTADEAKGKADAVGVQAADLTRQMSAATRELTDAETAEKKEEEALVNLAICNSPRVIPFWSISNKGTFIDPLKPFAGYQARV